MPKSRQGVARELVALARAIDPMRAAEFGGRLGQALPAGSAALGIGVLLASAYPAVARALEADPSIALRIAAEGHEVARDRAGLLARLREAMRGDAGLAGLRRATEAERIRIALRELLPVSLGGADVDVTAAELAALAEADLE